MYGNGEQTIRGCAVDCTESSGNSNSNGTVRAACDSDRCNSAISVFTDFKLIAVLLFASACLIFA